MPIASVKLDCELWYVSHTVLYAVRRLSDLELASAQERNVLRVR
jgi:hypothetical protein